MEMRMSNKQEKRPYNPYHLATGFAAKSLPDKVTASVFARLGAHTDFLGTTTVGIETLMAETLYSHGRVCDAIETLKRLKRITKVARYHPGKGRGRSTSVTRLHCTAEELERAGASQENFYDKGGEASEPVLQPRVKRKLKTKRDKETGKFACASNAVALPRNEATKIQPTDTVKSNLRDELNPIDGRNKVRQDGHEPFFHPCGEPLGSKPQCDDDEKSKSLLEGKKEKATPQGKSPLPTPHEVRQGDAAARPFPAYPRN